MQRHGGGAGWPSQRGSAVCGCQRGKREAEVLDRRRARESRRQMHHEVEPVDVVNGDCMLCSASDLLGFGGVEELRAKVQH